MAINFPDNPSDGDIATIGGVTYTYTASSNSWKPPSPGASASTLTDLNISDGTSGQLLTTDGNNNFSFTSISSASSTEIFADMAALIAKTGMSAGDQGLVLDNNKLFMYTGSAWYLIATMVNNSPTAITNVDGEYSLSQDGTPTVITAVSTDPEGFALTWSYAITSGSLGSTATISQTDNVFTITPSTNTADMGNFSITISATDGGSSGIVNKVIYITLAFTVSNSRYTTLLATATGTSDNNNITDSSTNNHSITVNGDAHAGAFSPYRSGGYSTYFDGNRDYIITPSDTDFAFGTGDFTIEHWFNCGNQIDDYPRSFAIGPTYNTGSVGGNIDDTDNPNKYAFYARDLVHPGRVLLSTSDINDNAWHHVAITRQSGDFYLYIDGVLEDTNSSYSGSVGTAAQLLAIGGVATEISGEDYVGYISDFRVVKGTAIYDGNFTPPTEPLEEVTNTKLLTCHLPYLVDGSTNNHAITVNGNVTTQPLSPYDYGEYNPTIHGGSVYFDGSGDYLTISSSGSTIGALSAFTVEGWYWPDPSSSGYDAVYSSAGGVSTGYQTAGRLYNYNGSIILYWTNVDQASGSGSWKLGTWNHFAVTHDGTTTEVYVNGVQEISTTSASFSGTTDIQVSEPDYPAHGYISDFKISNSDIYTGDFTPPTAPVSSSGADLHIKGTDASIIDKSQGDNIKLIGNVTGSNTQTKYASHSMYFDGQAGGINLPDQELYGFGTGDFTIDFWLNWTGGNGYAFFLINNGGAGNYIGYGLNTGTITPFVWNNGNVIIGSSNITVNTWQHHAIVRNAGVLTIYLDGYSIGSNAAWGVDLGQSRPFYIGHNAASGQTTTGYIEDLRVTKGLARYTANFTPPTNSLTG